MNFDGGANPFGGCRIVAIAMDCKSIDFGLRQFESGRPQYLAQHLRKTIPRGYGRIPFRHVFPNLSTLKLGEPPFHFFHF